MKKLITYVLIACSVTFFISSCDKEDISIENKDVTGTFSYIQKEFIPLTFDSTGMNVLSAKITMEGTGNISELGSISMLSSFKFDFIAGKGFDFITTYSGSNPSDSFSSTGSSILQPDGTFLVTDVLNGGKGKFAKISGGGNTKVTLTQTRDSGTGVVNWKVSY